MNNLLSSIGTYANNMLTSTYASAVKTGKSKVNETVRFAFGIDNIDKACKALTSSSSKKSVNVEGAGFVFIKPEPFSLSDLPNRVSKATGECYIALGKGLFWTAMAGGALSKSATAEFLFGEASMFSARSAAEGVYTITLEGATLVAKAGYHGAKPLVCYTAETIISYPKVSAAFTLSSYLLYSAVQDLSKENKPTITLNDGKIKVVENGTSLVDQAKTAVKVTAKLATVVGIGVLMLA